MTLHNSKTVLQLQMNVKKVSLGQIYMVTKQFLSRKGKGCPTCE
jgi:hypothetical protein